MASRSDVLRLYRQLLRSGARYPDYNFREYVLRRTRDQFRANRGLQDRNQIFEAFQRGSNDLGVVQRQAAISAMYTRGSRVIDDSPVDARQR